MRVLLLVIAILASACGGGEDQNAKIVALANRACACAKKNDMNFSVESIQAATQSRVDGVDRVAQCAAPVVDDLEKLAGAINGATDEARHSAVRRLSDCLDKAGASDSRTSAALQKLTEKRAEANTPQHKGALGQLEAFKTTMCNCKDRQCTEIVARELDAWRKTKPALDPDAATQFMTQLQDCAAKLAEPPPPPSSELDGLKTEMCDCKDRACTEAVRRKVEGWLTVDRKLDPSMAMTLDAITACETKHAPPVAGD